MSSGSTIATHVDVAAIVTAVGTTAGALIAAWRSGRNAKAARGDARKAHGDAETAKAEAGENTRIISLLVERIDTLEGKVATLTDELGKARERVRILEAENASLTGALGSALEEVQRLEAELAVVRAELDAVKARRPRKIAAERA